MIGIRNEIFTTPNPNLVAGDFGEWSRWYPIISVNTAGHDGFYFEYCKDGIMKDTRLVLSCEIDTDGMEVKSADDVIASFDISRSDKKKDARSFYASYSFPRLKQLSNFPATGTFGTTIDFMTEYDFQNLGLCFSWHNLKGRFRFRRLKVERGSWSPYVIGGGRNQLCVITLRHLLQGRAAA